MLPARAMVLTACATAAAGGGEGMLDGVAGGGRGTVHFSPRGASVSERSQDEERGGGKGDGGRERERPRHEAWRCVHHLTEPEAEQETGEAAPSRRDQQDRDGAGVTRASRSGTRHGRSLALAR